MGNRHALFGKRPTEKDSHERTSPAAYFTLRGGDGGNTAPLPGDSFRLGVLYVLVFLETGSRRVIFCNATARPDSAWVAQQARNVAWELDELKIPIKVLIPDRDSKFGSDFDAVFSTAGPNRPNPVPEPARERCLREVLGTLRRECLDWLIILGECHLVQVLREYFDHYNRARPHRALRLRPPEPQPIPDAGPIVRRQRLHGLINEYSHAA